MTSNLTHLVSNYGLIAVFAGTFIQGEGILITAGILAGNGLLNPVTVWLTASLGAWLGHLFWFLVGRRLGYQSALSRYKWLGERIGRADKMIQRHPGTSIFTLQYLYGFRIIGAIALGLTQLSFGRFAFYEALNCPLWAAIIESAGYFLGKAVTKIFYGWAGWIWLALSVVVVSIFVVRYLKPFHSGKKNVE